MDSAEETFDEEIPVFQRPKNFRWNSTMVAYLIDSLYNYKAEMEYKHLDFNGDKPAQYTAVRQKMGVKYPHFFGPENPVEILTSMTPEQKSEAKKINGLIKKGHNLVLEKIKETQLAPKLEK